MESSWGGSFGLVESSRLTLQCSAPENWGDVRIIRTPSDYFAFRYPGLAERYGAPVLEQHLLGSDGVLRVTPIEPNIDFFAGVIGGDERQSKVIFFQPEHLFYYADPLLGHFTPTSEEKLHLCLSQEFVHCAGYFSQQSRNVDVGPLFQEFRSGGTLKSIVERAKALLAKDESFFAEGAGNRKDPICLSGLQTTRLFVEEAVESKPGSILKIGEAYDKYWYFCDLKGLPAVGRNNFRDPSVAAIKAKFGNGIRRDLKLNGKWIDGWKDLEVCENLDAG